MDSARFTDWLQDFAREFEAGAADTLAKLFAEDIEYHHSPFEAPLRGRQVLSQFFRDTLDLRRETEFKVEAIHSHADTGWAHWKSTFTRKGTEDPVRQEGIFKVVRNGEGLCVDLRQWWNSLEPGQGDLMRDFDA